MNAKRLLAVALAALLVTSGVAAAAGDGSMSTNGTAKTDASANVNVAGSYRDGAITLTVTRDGSPVSNVDVSADGRHVGTTDADGSVTFETDPSLLDHLAGSTIRVRFVSEEFSGELGYAVRNGELVRTRAQFTNRTNATADARADADVSADVDADVNASAESDERAAVDGGVSANASTGAASAADANATHTVSARAESASEAHADAESSAEHRGPVMDLPEQAANHVARIHAAVRSFLSGSVGGSLGATIRGIVGGGADASAGGHARTGANASAGVGNGESAVGVHAGADADADASV